MNHQKVLEALLQVDEELAVLLLEAPRLGERPVVAELGAGYGRLAFFVIRAKTNLRFRRLYSQPIEPATGVLCDQRPVEFTRAELQDVLAGLLLEPGDLLREGMDAAEAELKRGAFGRPREDWDDCGTRASGSVS